MTMANTGSAGTLVAHEAGAVPRELGKVDVVFPLLHGPWGEDGTIQGLLEMVGVRYVGAGVLSSAVGMDKHYMKLVLRASGLPVLPYTVFTAADWRRDPSACAESVASLRYPVFVKPCRGGSSIGIARVSRPEDLPAAVELALEYDPKVIVEAGASGVVREVECGILDGLGNDPPKHRSWPRSRSTKPMSSTTSAPSTSTVEPLSPFRRSWTIRWPRKSDPCPCGRSRYSVAKAWPESTSS